MDPIVASTVAGIVSLTPLWDTETPLRNPRKGWYHHYYDQGTGPNYQPGSDEELLAVPGLDHLYIRLAWSDLEPERGRYRWSLIDDVVEKWVPRGYGISFRVTCKETGITYATPKWVADLGAKGELVPTIWGGDLRWRPDYGDPVFLRELERFHRAFAARYDGKPWVEYIDIGSYGDWGEGHNSATDRKRWPFSVLREHLAIYRRCYRRTPLVVSDDLPTEGVEGPPEPMLDEIIQSGITFRDDSIGVGWYYQHHLETDTVRSPEYFERVWRDRPTVMELQHYGHMRNPKGDNTWIGPDGSERGAEYLRGALKRMRASYIGYHGFAADWMKDNPNLTRELLNKMGYWYFPQSLEVLTPARPGRVFRFAVTWLNQGVAPAYQRFPVRLRLGSFERELKSDSRRWMPDEPYREEYSVRLPPDLALGDEELCLGLSDRRRGLPTRPVRLGLKASTHRQGDTYALATLRVEK
jgi:hypothetical protein